MSPIVALLLASIAHAAPCPASSLHALTACVEARLDAQPALVETPATVQPGQLNRGEIGTVIDVPLDAALTVLLDFDDAESWVPDLVEAELLASHGGVLHCAGQTNLPWPVADRTWQLEMTHVVHTRDGVHTHLLPYRYIAGSGNLDEFFGYWALQSAGPDGQQTRVHYVAHVDLGFWAPGVLIKWAMGRILPGMVDNLQEQAAGATSGLALETGLLEPGLTVDEV